MRNVFLLISALTFLNVSVFAQQTRYNTCIQVNYSMFHHSKSGMYFIPEQVGITAIRHLNNDISFDLGFQTWFLGKDGGSMIVLADDEVAIGAIKGRHSYKAFDGSVRYNFVNSKRHNIYGGIGMSYVWGQVKYISAFSKVPGYLDIQYNLSNQSVHHTGVNFLAGYNLKIAKERINLGMSSRYRVLSRDLIYYDVNFNIGYNFNCFSKKAKKSN